MEKYGLKRGDSVFITSDIIAPAYSRIAVFKRYQGRTDEDAEAYYVNITAAGEEYRYTMEEFPLFPGEFIPMKELSALERVIYGGDE